MNWWRERCLEWCHDRVEDGRFADQKYLDDWPTRFRSVVVLQHKGAGLAPWNVSGSELRDEAGNVLVDNQPLIFYHFHHLRRLTSYLVDPGLDDYGARMGATLRKRVYAPYLRELKSWNARPISGTSGSWSARPSLLSGKLDRGHAPQRKGSAKSWLRNSLLLIAGSASISLCLLPRTGVVVLSRVALARLRGQGMPARRRLREAAGHEA